VWRVGHISGPLELPPWDHCSWANRFDDLDRQFRTLYCARARRTALRETLADFRPNTKALAELRLVLAGGEEPPLAEVPRVWRNRRRLAPARMRFLSGELVGLDDPVVRAELEREHADLLALHGMDHLDISQIRSRDRAVTQRIAQSLFNRGAAGIAFGSNLDDLRCYALFEARCQLIPDGEPEVLTASHPDLLAVCKEFGLALND
jgi:hypothetical protein